MDILTNPLGDKTATPDGGEMAAPNKKNQIYSAIIIFVIVVLFYILYRKFSQNSKAAKELKLKNKELIDKLNQVMLEPENGGDDIEERK